MHYKTTVRGGRLVQLTLDGFLLPPWETLVARYIYTNWLNYHHDIDTGLWPSPLHLQKMIGEGYVELVGDEKETEGDFDVLQEVEAFLKEQTNGV